MVAFSPLEVEIAMGRRPVPIYVSRGNFPPRYEVPKFLPRGGHLCMAMLTIAVPVQQLDLGRFSYSIDSIPHGATNRI